MRAPDIVVYVPNRAVQGPVLILSCCDGNSRLVAPEDDWYEGGIGTRLPLANYILEKNSAY